MILHVTYLSRRDVGFIAAAATAVVDNTSERQATEKIDFISIREENSESGKYNIVGAPRN